MPPGSDYFPLAEQGSKVFLPINCVVIDNSRKNDHSLMKDWEMIDKEDNSTEVLHDAMTHQPSATATTYDNYFLGNFDSKQNTDRLNMYGKVICHCCYIFSPYIIQSNQSTKFKGRISNKVQWSNWRNKADKKT